MLYLCIEIKKQTMQIDKRKSYTVRETATIKGCTITHIYNLIYTNKIKSFQLGGMYFIKGTEVEKLLNKSK